VALKMLRHFTKAGIAALRGLSVRDEVCPVQEVVRDVSRGFPFSGNLQRRVWGLRSEGRE
jgi:hypothetical protein